MAAFSTSMAGAAAAAAQLSVAIIGGSIGGLAAATAFHRLGWKVKVFEKAASQGLGGSLGFCDVQLWQRVKGERMIRRGTQASRMQGAFLYNDLWRFWFSALPEGTVEWGTIVTDLGDDPAKPTVKGETFDLAVIADGGWSSLRDKYFGTSREPEYAGYQVYRFRVRADKVPGFDAYGEYYSRAPDGTHYATILLDVAQDNDAMTNWIMGGTTVAMPESEVVRPAKAASRQTADDGPTPPPPDWFLPFYKKHFGNQAGGEIYRAMEAAAREGKVAALPQYEFAAKQVTKGRLILVGDAAHMASPRTASGAHTAVLDAAALLEAFFPVTRTIDGVVQSAEGVHSRTVDEAIAAYGPPAVARAWGLYRRSLEVSAPVCAPGWKRGDGVGGKGAQAREEL